MSDEFDLGPCCGCGRKGGVRNIICLEKKSPIPGKGWGCLVCHLSDDGAVAVCCDVCQQKIADTSIDTVLKHACAGYPAKDGRVPYADLKGVHRHDMSFHPGEE